DLDPRVFLAKEGRNACLLERAQELRGQGVPDLIVTPSVVESEELKRLFKKFRVRYRLLNAENEYQERRIISRAGRKGAITISTNMSGRGTDIKIDGGLSEKIGLAVLVTFKSRISPRLDHQLMGRAARQGRPGSTQALLCWNPLEHGFKAENFKTSQDGEINLRDHPEVLELINNTQELAEREISRNHLVQFLLDYMFFRQEGFARRFRTALIESFLKDRENGFDARDSLEREFYGWDLVESLESTWKIYLLHRRLDLTYYDNQIYTAKNYEKFKEKDRGKLKECLFEEKEQVRIVLRNNGRLKQKLTEEWNEMIEGFAAMESVILKGIKFPDEAPDNMRPLYRYKECSSPLKQRSGAVLAMTLPQNVSVSDKCYIFTAGSPLGEKGVILGLRCQSFAAIPILTELPITMIELTQFPQGERFTIPKGNGFEAIEEHFIKLKQFIDEKQLTLQVHFPFRFDGEDREISIGNAEDHERIIGYLRCWELIRRKLSLSEELIFTLHPPSGRRVDLKEKINPDRLLSNANILLIRLGDIIERESWGIRIGVENLPSSLSDFWFLGNQIGHFRRMLANTKKCIGITPDSGHSLLTRGYLNFHTLYTFAKQEGKGFSTIHFHENKGLGSAKKRNLMEFDLHEFPTRKGLPMFDECLRLAVRDRVPLTLEIDISKYAIPVLSAMIDDLWKELEAYNSSSPLDYGAKQRMYMAMKIITHGDYERFSMRGKLSGLNSLN
ncbi:MAG: hypothetical protein AABZ27_00835, partial [Candidatus Omnitrophota bacterium]